MNAKMKSSVGTKRPELETQICPKHAYIKLCNIINTSLYLRIITILNGNENSHFKHLL